MALSLLRRIFRKIRFLYKLTQGIDPLTGIQFERASNLVEIGTKYGGWVIPDGFLDADSICYCIGCGEDITFDLGIIDTFGSKVFAFDPTPRSIEYVEPFVGKYENFYFFPIGLWDQKDSLKFYVPKVEGHVSHSLTNINQTTKYIVVDVDRLKNLMIKNGHARLDLLKIDIEGAEYRVIDSILEDQIEIDILCIEYDEATKPQDEEAVDRIRNSLHKLFAKGWRLSEVQGWGNYTLIHENSSYFR